MNTNVVNTIWNVNHARTQYQTLTGTDTVRQDSAINDKKLCCVAVLFAVQFLPADALKLTVEKSVFSDGSFVEMSGYAMLRVGRVALQRSHNFKRVKSEYCIGKSRRRSHCQYPIELQKIGDA